MNEENNRDLQKGQEEQGTAAGQENPVESTAGQDVSDAPQAEPGEDSGAAKAAEEPGSAEHTGEAAAGQPPKAPQASPGEDSPGFKPGSASSLGRTVAGWFSAARDRVSGWWASLQGYMQKSTGNRNKVIGIATGALVLLVIVIAVASSQKAIPQGVVVKVSSQRSFASTGSFDITGVGDFSAKELTGALSFYPPVHFQVDKEQGDKATITLENHRNIMYKGTVQVGDPEAEGSYKATFNVNAPELTVRVGNTASALGKHDPLRLVFSEQVDIYSLQENMVIEPKTAYSMSYDLDTVTITPDVEWIVTENYQIKINAEYASKTGKEFVDNQVVSFKVRNQEKSVPASTPSVSYTPYINFRSGNNYVQGEGKEMSLSFNAERLKDNVPVLVETYRMDSLEKYRDQSHIFLGYDIDLSSLEKLDTNAFLIQNGENRFTVPNFGYGPYILNAIYKDPASGEEKQVRTSYFVTPLSVYMQSSSKETVVWLNSKEADAPLDGYQVQFDGEKAPGGVTDSQGLLVLPHDEEASRSSASFSIKDAQGTLVYYDDTSLHMERYQHERYYSYLFTDRTLYKPEDEIQVWGYIAPFRYNERELPDTVTLRFDSGGLDIEVEVPLADSGIFHGTIPLEKIKSSQYNLQAEVFFPAQEEEEIGTRHTFESLYLSVKEYEKPTYVLSSVMNKDYYGPDDEVTVTASASFYDGSPLPHFPLEVSYYNPSSYSWVSLPDVKTDSSGNATFSFPANPGGATLRSEKYLRQNQYKVAIASDGESITHMKQYRYFPSDVLIEYGVERQGLENLQLTVRTYKLDMSSPTLIAAMEQSGSGYYSLTNERLLQMARGEPIDTKLNIALRWNYYDPNNILHQNRQKQSRGGTYIVFDNAYSLDYTTQERRQMEVIEDWETMEKLISVQTTEGVALVRDLIYVPEESAINFEREVSLRATIGYADSHENSCSETAYYPGRQYFPDEEEDYYYEEREPEPIKGYSFAITDVASGEDLTPTAAYYMEVPLNADSQARFDLLLDGEPVETNGRILYTIIQDGLYEEQVVNGESFLLTYPMGYGRNVRMVAVYFDGEETRYVKQLDLTANTQSMAVNLEVTPNKTSYRPGEQVTLQISATDYLGRGVAGNMVVSIVDESIFALSEQNVSLLYDLYSNVMSIDNSVRQYCTTYRDEAVENSYHDGGKGEGGAVEFYDSYRSNFKDTALFLPTTTNSAGNATVTFTLPDNTTSWRITTLEIADNLRAGQSKSNIISTLPFFTKPVITSKYIDGDDVAMLIQGHGTLLDEDSEITYTVTMTGDDYSQTLTGEGKAYQAVEFNFGKLPIGEYTVVARSQFSGYSDTVELPVTVIKSNLELVVHRPVEIGTGQLDIEAMRYPVSITLYDNANEPFLTSINSLFGHYCMQASQRMSRFVAKRVVRQTVEGGGRIPSYIAEGNDYASDMQNDDGGIGYYVGAESEPQITTYVLLVAKDNFNLNSMSRYYRRQLETLKDPKERAACYLGLAAIESIEAEELLEVLEDEETELPVDVQAYLVAALAYLGETETANELYTTLLADAIKDINDGKHKDLDWERDAAAIWIAASRLEHPDADTLSLHFGKSTWRYRTLFECMIYVTNYNRPVTSTSFSYTVKGSTYTVNLGLQGMRTLVLSKSDLESLRFNNPPESLRAVAYYVGEPVELGLNQSENMSIDKTVVPLNDNTYEVTLTIHLTKDAPTGEYDISDWVPSNSRIYSFDKNYKTDVQTYNFTTSSELQNLYVSFNNRANREQTIKYSYRIRQTFQSEAMLDTVYMIHGDSGENCNSEKVAFKPQATAADHPVITVDGAGPGAPESGESGGEEQSSSAAEAEQSGETSSQQDSETSSEEGSAAE